jgi:hypothetical protein
MTTRYTNTEKYANPNISADEDRITTARNPRENAIAQNPLKNIAPNSNDGMSSNI